MLLKLNNIEEHLQGPCFSFKCVQLTYCIHFVAFFCAGYGSCVYPARYISSNFAELWPDLYETDHKIQCIPAQGVDR